VSSLLVERKKSVGAKFQQKKLQENIFDVITATGAREIGAGSAGQRSRISFTFYQRAKNVCSRKFDDVNCCLVSCRQLFLFKNEVSRIAPQWFINVNLCAISFYRVFSRKSNTTDFDKMSWKSVRFNDHQRGQRLRPRKQKVEDRFVSR